MRRVVKFCNENKGVTSIEYGVLAAGLAGVIALVLGDDGVFTEALTNAFETVAGTIESQTAGGSEGS
ncbi:Flp family type IVb pilin [Vibrio tapetis subsp. quintayensis]|uniref:Flp family type IVb pilin n=1 Tax=Vibrio tapetis TaxID=52443 RepID=UPI0025B61783|nr:Flp family type IVb pilin [Vibrio tapetis]MDN3680459.1 Flp family type IVb pilin [Vibrio tapetis subsp. quintayensis]